MFAPILQVDLDSTPLFTIETWGCNPPHGMVWDLMASTSITPQQIIIKKQEFLSFMVLKKIKPPTFFFLLLRHLRGILKQKKGLNVLDIFSSSAIFEVNIVKSPIINLRWYAYNIIMEDVANAQRVKISKKVQFEIFFFE